MVCNNQRREHKTQQALEGPKTIMFCTQTLVRSDKQRATGARRSRDCTQGSSSTRPGILHVYKLKIEK